MAYTNKAKKRTSFIKGKTYHLDALFQELPNNVIANMFRKPLIDEKTPDGIKCKTQMESDCSDYHICIASFAITISILFNSPSGN